MRPGNNPSPGPVNVMANNPQRDQPHKPTRIRRELVSDETLNTLAALPARLCGLDQVVLFQDKAWPKQGGEKAWNNRREGTGCAGQDRRRMGDGTRAKSWIHREPQNTQSTRTEEEQEGEGVEVEAGG